MVTNNFFILSGADLDQAISLAKKMESKSESNKPDSSTVRKRPREESIVQSSLRQNLFRSTPESESHTPSSEYKGTPKSIKELKTKYEKDLAKVTLSAKKVWCKHIVEKARKMRAENQQFQAEEQAKEQEQPQNDSPEVFDDHFNAWIEDAAKED
tara:strand:+ start:202 stop:666 length:465 start_codon:yes stop_codon:yes gene_type:complete